VKAEIIESAPRRANVYARIKGKKSGDGLILHNHIDVVPADPKEWEVPPFSGAIRLNMVYGRGSVDMKSIALCELEGFLGVARSGRQPERDIIFLATADEEEGSALGIRWLLDHRPDIFDGVKYAITEGGVTEMQKETVTYYGIEIGSKQRVELDLVANDEATLQRARIALEPYFRPGDPDRVLPGVREFFRAVAPRRLEFREHRRHHRRRKILAASGHDARADAEQRVGSRDSTTSRRTLRHVGDVVQSSRRRS